MKVKCKKCGNEWGTKSKKKLISCTSCGDKNRVDPNDPFWWNQPRSEKEVGK